MTNNPGTWWQGIAALCRWGLAWLSIGLFTLLAGINLLRTAFMDMNRESSRRELVPHGADHPLHFLLFLAAALAFTALWLQRQWQCEEGRPGWKLLLSAMCIALAVLLKSFARILLVAQCIVLAVWALPNDAAGLNGMAALKTLVLRLRGGQEKKANAV